MMKRVVTSFFAILLSLVVVAQVSAADNTTRLGGQDRFSVSINVSKEGWNRANTVVLANWEAYGDALAAAPLAYKNDGPLLLTKADKLTPRTKAEIERLKAKKVIIVGGPISVSEGIVKELKNMGVTVERISGENRMEVANNIAKKIGPTSKVAIADGFNFPDALSIAPWAARNGYPILLTNTKHNLTSDTQKLINSWNINETIISGGPLSVSETVSKNVPNPKRFGGNHRYDVSANIANTYFQNSNEAFVTKGTVFADALTGSVLAAKKNAPILLIKPDSLTDAVSNSITKNGYGDFTILGGNISVSEKVEKQLDGELVGKTILVDPGHGGKDPGAVGNKMEEKEIVLDIGKRLNDRLKGSLAKVVMTRDSDEFVELPDRVKEGEKAKADLFISIHVNAFYDSSANGTETYYNSQYVGAESKALATEIQTELVKAMGTRDRGVKEANFHVIKNSKMPSVLVEVAFISNKSDADKLASKSYRNKAGDAIYRGIMNYYN